jgi:adenine-specific DNA-methyltransferase
MMERATEKATVSETTGASGESEKHMQKVYRRYASNREIVVQGGEAINLLRKLPDESVSLTLTSPPYCIGKEYETSTSVHDFKEIHAEILPEIVRVTKNGGSICWQVGYHVRNRVVQPLDYYVYELFQKFPEIKLRNRIIWSFGHGLHDSARFTGRHEVIMWFTKGNKYFFDLDPVRIPQRYPGKKYYKGPKKGEYSGNPLGKNPSDIWDIPNVNANHCEKTSHPCQFPVGLAERVVKALCPKNGLVLDPYAGVCTTGVAAALNGRRFVGVELVEDYRSVGIERIEQAIRGELKYRPADTPIFEPDAAGSVARKPSHFK